MRCENCGVDFEQKTTNNRFCSKSCRENSKGKRHRSKRKSQKKCTTCGSDVTINPRNNQFYYRCTECRFKKNLYYREKRQELRKKAIDRYAVNCEEIKARLRNKHKKYKQKFLDLYGGECVNCAESNPNLLTIDHILNDGKQHRQEMGNTRSVLKDAIDNYNPGRFRILCYNCNCYRGRFNELPYEDEKILGILSLGG
jgi:5'(3')-deoxyribonucleotidase